MIKGFGRAEQSLAGTSNSRHEVESNRVHGYLDLEALARRFAENEFAPRRFRFGQESTEGRNWW